MKRGSTIMIGSRGNEPNHKSIWLTTVATKKLYVGAIQLEIEFIQGKP